MAARDQARRHRLLAIADSAREWRLISRNGHNRTELFSAPFDGIVALGRELILDGEIAVPDEGGCTHIGDLQDDVARGRRERLAYCSISTATICAAARSRGGRRSSSAR
jgi:ATP-dependent DNA ligase